MPTMSTSLPILAFIATSLLVIVYERRKRSEDVALKSRKLALSKEEVIRLRAKHFMKAVSVSYANSGGLMITGVNKSTMMGS